MSLDLPTVRRIAGLARIRMEDAELTRVQGELNGILGWIEQLQAVPTEGVAPYNGPAASHTMPMRADVVTEADHRDEVLANAPDREDVYFGVPKVVE